MSGFFGPSDVIAPTKTKPSLIPRCGSCGLKDRCVSPKIPLYGRGERKVLIVGEAPGVTEDSQNRLFVGKEGRFLRDSLTRIGVDLERDCWATNAIICRPTVQANTDGVDYDNTRTPTDREIEYCRPNLLRIIQETNPEVILLFGGSAIESLIGWLWRADVGLTSRWEGWRIPSQQLNAWVCPTFDLQFVMREAEDRRGSVANVLFHQHLAAAFELSGRPWKKVPDWESRVEVVEDADVAAKRIRRFIEAGNPVSFDYETNMLKPDSRDAAIHCCSVSDGRVSVAFPWYGEAVTAMKDLIRSNLPKILFNAKFEKRWTQRILKISIRNVVWCGMLAAHVLDNRREITGLAFQEFAVLGMANHKDGIAPYLKGVGSGGNVRNRITEAPLRKILFYCAMDSLVEYKLAIKQARQMGVKL